MWRSRSIPLQQVWCHWNFNQTGADLHRKAKKRCSSAEKKRQQLGICCQYKQRKDRVLYLPSACAQFPTQKPLKAASAIGKCLQAEGQGLRRDCRWRRVHFDHWATLLGRCRSDSDFARHCGSIRNQGDHLYADGKISGKLSGKQSYPESLCAEGRRRDAHILILIWIYKCIDDRIQILLRSSKQEL